MFRTVRLTTFALALAGLLPAAAKAQDVALASRAAFAQDVDLPARPAAAKAQEVTVAVQPPADAPVGELPPPSASTTTAVVTDDSPYWYQGSDGVAYWYNPQVTTWAYSRVERRWVSAAVARRVLIGSVGLRPVGVARPAVVRPAVRPVVRADVVRPVAVERTVIQPVAARPAILPRRR